MPDAFEKLRVLVVDDSGSTRFLLRRVLQSLGVGTILDAADGPTGFRTFVENAIDLVILDWAMAPMDGLELTRLIRTSEDSPDPFVPIIMLSGHVDRMRAARDAGVSEFMMKPVSVRTFLACLGAVVERPRPFVRANGYFGPDRRRMLTPFSGPDRRTQPHTY